MTVRQDGYATLLMVQELVEVEVSTLVERLPEVDVKNAVNSLKRGTLIESVRLVNRRFVDSRSTRTYPVSVYAITEKGRAAIRKFEESAERKATIVPRVFAVHKQKGTKVVSTKQETHQMRNFVIPDFAPNVTEGVIEIDGALVKCTRGVGYAYEKLRPETDLTRYIARPVKGIHAL